MVIDDISNLLWFVTHTHIGATPTRSIVKGTG